MKEMVDMTLKEIQAEVFRKYGVKFQRYTEKEKIFHTV